MKKNLSPSSIPNDIKYRLGLAGSRLQDALLLVDAVAPVAFPGGEHAALRDALVTALLRYEAIEAARPRKRTEATQAPEAVEAGPAPEPVQAAEEPAVEAAPEAVQAVEAPVEVPAEEPVQAAPVDRLALIKEAARRRKAAKEAEVAA
jgi:hypothetical protein